MKTYKILSIIAGLFATTAMAPAAVVTNINQTFEGYSEGALPMTNGWAKSGGMNVTVITNIVYDGANAMRLERTSGGAVTYTTASAPNIQLNLAANSEYQWNFAFRIDEASSTNAGASTIGLDTGSGTSFAGLRLEYTGGAWVARYYSSLTNSFSSQTNFSLFGNLATDTWYVASFSITTDASLNISQSNSILSGTNVLYSGNVSNQENLAGTNAVRMNWSPGPNGVIQQYDNLYLATIPEPGTVALMSLGALAFIFARRHRQRGEQ